MLLIFGLNGYTDVLGELPALCGRCHNHAMHHVIKQGNKFSLFFIPLLTVSAHYALACTICGQQRSLSKEEAQSLASGRGVEPIQPLPRPPQDPGGPGGFPQYPRR